MPSSAGCGFLRESSSKTLTAAGRALAKTDPDRLSAHLENLLRRRSKPIYRLAARCFAAGPDRWADRAIRWLLAGPGPASMRTRPPRLSILAGPPLDPQVFRHLFRRCFCRPPVSDTRPPARMGEKGISQSRHEILLGTSELFGRPRYDILTDNDLGLGQHRPLVGSAQTANANALRGLGRRPRTEIRSRKTAVERCQPADLAAWWPPPFPATELRHLSNRQWLAVIQGRWPQRGESLATNGPRPDRRGHRRDLFRRLR